MAFYFYFFFRFLPPSAKGFHLRNNANVAYNTRRYHCTRTYTLYAFDKNAATTPSLRCSFFAHYIVYVTMSLRRERVYLYAVYLQTRDNQKRRRFLRAAIIERRRRMTNSEGRQTRPFVKNVVRY